MEAFANKFAVCGFSRDAFLPCYGLAEATLFVSGSALWKSHRLPTLSPQHCMSVGAAPPRGHERSYSTSGHVAQELEVLVVDPDTGRRVPDGQFGEIWVAGPSNAAGYWKRPAETAATFLRTLAGESTKHYLAPVTLARWLMASCLSRAD